MNAPVFYKDKPIFGFDLGHSSIKVVQVEKNGRKTSVIGYGTIDFDPIAVKKGVLVDIETIAKQTVKLFKSNIIGKIETKRVTSALPAGLTYSRIVTLPPMESKDVESAILLEVEQSIPVPLAELYVDYEVVYHAKDGSVEVLVVAAPKSIVDSYLNLFAVLGLEVVLFETTINSVARTVSHADNTSVPTLIIDFGSISSDLAVFDHTIRVTGTADWGGETLSKEIAKVLRVSLRQAQTIKNRYGLDVSKKQTQIAKALQPVLTQLINEIRRISRFYTERSGDNSKISQIVILGGGANLPGLSGYLTDKLRIATRLVDPLQNISFGRLQPPHKLERTLYSTAVGLSLLKSGDI
ncbi:MAG TPA: type IV pilus assembly protein PilM [Candidatus Saccharimonadales bacterium]